MDELLKLSAMSRNVVRRSEAHLMMGQNVDRVHGI